MTLGETSISTLIGSTDPLISHALQTNPLRGSLHVHPHESCLPAINSLHLSQREPLPAVDTAYVRALLKFEAAGPEARARLSARA